MLRVFFQFRNKGVFLLRVVTGCYGLLRVCYGFDNHYFVNLAHLIFMICYGFHIEKKVFARVSIRIYARTRTEKLF